MRKITRAAAEAFKDRRDWHQSNTEVVGGPGPRTLYLHGNQIARSTNTGIALTLAGWPTPTTRERLNGLLQVLGHDCGFHQEDHAQIFSWGNGDDSGRVEIEPYDRIIVSRHGIYVNGQAVR